MVSKYANQNEEISPWDGQSPNLMQRGNSTRYTNCNFMSAPNGSPMNNVNKEPKVYDNKIYSNRLIGLHRYERPNILKPNLS